MPKPREPTAGFWIVVGLTVLALYVLTSGPTRMIACRRVTFTGVTSTTTKTTVYEAWWRQVFDPLRIAAEQPWGEPIRRYWNLFPLPDAQW